MSVISVVKERLLKGLLVALPLIVSVLLIWFLWSILIYLIELFPSKWVFFGADFGQLLWVKFLAWFIVIYVLGSFSVRKIGKKSLAYLEDKISWFPLIRSIYQAVKDGVKLFFESKEAFKQVVLVEYPRKGLWSIAFVTQKVQKEGKRYISVFLPTTPNPTSGFILMMPEDEVKVLPMGVEEGIKFVISLGSSGKNALNFINERSNNNTEGE